MSAASPSAALASPVAFHGTELHALIPHRGDILFASALTVVSRDHFQGTACWRVDQAGLAGHFPGAPIVPAVFLVEAAAQIAGAGLVATRSPDAAGASRIGVMAGIRRCNFTRPVFPGQTVHFDLRLGRATAGFALCSGDLEADGRPAGELAFILALADADAVLGPSPAKEH